LASFPEGAARSREDTVSSALLYLAIVAIWAVVLVPRWVRRSHDAPGTAENTSAQPETLTAAADTPVPEYAPAPGYDAVPEYDAAVEYSETVEYSEARADGTVREYGAAVEYAAAVEDGTTVEYGRAIEYSAVLDDRAVPADVAAGQHDDGAAADPDSGGEHRLSLRGRPLWSEGPGWHPFRRPERPRPVVSRAAALRARRRMLTTLVALTAMALALAAGSMVPWWVVFPPVVMLGAFVLLLREAAHADADAARWQAAADAVYAAREARLDARQRVRDKAMADLGPEPIAEIIDISDRVGDQLYDQYADAAVRAVGD
jgi:hypothetical protein